MGANLPLFLQEGGETGKSPLPLWAEPQLYPPAGLRPSLGKLSLGRGERLLLQFLLRLKVTHSSQRSKLIDGKAGTGAEDNWGYGQT